MREADQRAAARAVFEQVDRCARGATTLRFLNNGGRSKLLPLPGDGDGTPIPLAPTIHRAIATDVLTAAHAYARTVHGRRADWPTHITIARPDVPEADDGEFQTPDDGVWVEARLVVPGVQLLGGGPLGPWRYVYSAHTRETTDHREGVTQLILTGPGSPDSRRRVYRPDDQLVVRRPDLGNFPTHAEEEAPDVLSRLDRLLAKRGAHAMSLSSREQHIVAYYLAHTDPVMAPPDSPAAGPGYDVTAAYNRYRDTADYDLLNNFAARRRWIASYRHIAALADGENGR
ncbi:hypothetical protein [Streptomyces sp. MP131-18]|uniref:hypothetical protein n=1 Tax=Streptomyces sp. MP131-18 TaxID=1857892 RepID=UPI00097CC01A|nr:hypothetical protein [Streptomyces sp. MP131-18]ONK13276.1 hypothetical protein STBA_40390 [Streptomyces sp. MP131-18]